MILDIFIYFYMLPLSTYLKWILNRWMLILHCRILSRKTLVILKVQLLITISSKLCLWVRVGLLTWLGTGAGMSGCCWRGCRATCSRNWRRRETAAAWVGCASACWWSARRPSWCTLAPSSSRRKSIGPCACSRATNCWPCRCSSAASSSSSSSPFTTCLDPGPSSLVNQLEIWK